MAERGTSDIDRFLAEIDRLRKKAQSGPAPTAKAKPVVAKPVVEAKKPKARPRLEMPPAATIPTVAMARPVSSEGPVARAVPLTAPTIITPPGSVRVEAPLATVKTVQAAGQKTGRQQVTPFGRQLAAVIAGNQSVAMGFVLGEIFGPPKSRQG